MTRRASIWAERVGGTCASKLPGARRPKAGPLAFARAGRARYWGTVNRRFGPEDRHALPRILVVDDDPMVHAIVAAWLPASDYEVRCFLDAASLGFHLAGPDPADLVLLDLGLPDADGFTLIQRVGAARPGVAVVMLTADDSVSSVVRAVKLGATDYLSKPLGRAQLLDAVGRVVAHRAMPTVGSVHSGLHGLVGVSVGIQTLQSQIHRIAASGATTLLSGETGVGKDVVARGIHAAGARAEKPFVVINCAAIPAGLQESELYGHERGAFTGAVARRAGCFERAHGGTLFLDEVAELSAQTQAGLLTVLQNRRFYRVGGTQEVAVDVRIIAATHRDLRLQTQSGAFRDDLYFRIAAVELRVPPLRERLEDIALLAEHFLVGFANRDQRPLAHLAPDAVARLGAYDWPGNVRELQNVLESALVNAHSLEISASDLPPLGRFKETPLRDAPAAGVGAPAHESVDRLRADLIRQALAETDGNVSAAIRLLEIPRTTFYRRLKQLGIRDPGLAQDDPGPQDPAAGRRSR